DEWQPVGNDDLDFGMALFFDLGYADLAEKHFAGLSERFRGESGLIAALGLGIILKCQADAEFLADHRDEASALYERAREKLKRFPRRPREDRIRDLGLLELAEVELARIVLARMRALAEPEAEAGRERREHADELLRSVHRVLLDELQKWPEYDAHHHTLPTNVAKLERSASLLLDMVGLLEPGSAVFQDASARMLKLLGRCAEWLDEREVYGGVLWTKFMIGRLYALAGDLPKACKEGFDRVLGRGIHGFTGEPYRWVHELRMTVFLSKAEAAFEVGDYGLCARTVDRMLSPFVGYPCALDDHRGNMAALLRAEALMRLKGPDKGAALEECRRVVRRGLGRWPEVAREINAWIEAGAPQRDRIAFPPGSIEATGTYRSPRETGGLFVWPLGVGGGGAGRYGFRTGGGRSRAALRNGGSKTTERTVDAALKWLARNQHAGGWRADDNRRKKPDVAVTGLALLAFLGAGNTEKVSRYRSSVSRTVAHLTSRQDARGRIGTGGIDHVIAGLALLEAYGMARKPTTGRAAQRAVGYSISRLKETGGAWCAKPGERPDVVSTAWLVMQMRSAHLAGLELDYGMLRRTVDFLDECTERNGPRAGQVSLRLGDAPTPLATAAGLLTRVWFGWPRESSLVTRGADYLGKHLPDFRAAKGLDLRYLHFGGLAMFQMGGEYWKTWNATTREELVKRQVSVPADRSVHGSWPPARMGATGRGRAYSTAMGALCLEVYYRYYRLLGNHH
ncbi:MAG: prenyltransferase/squalene oxidase repeat-containing protein, partial [Planctomycetota bacterium]